MPDPKAGEIPQRVKYVNGDPVPEFPDECEPHTPDPDGYLQWHAWAERMAKTHVQRQCSGCGLWAIWEPKRKPPVGARLPGDEPREEENNAG